MKSYGIWIDRERAIVVEFSEGDAPRTSEIESGAPGRVKGRGGMRGARGQVDAGSHTKSDRRRLAKLDQFYDRVAKLIEGGDRVAVIGPGQTKKHLANKLEEERHAGELVAVLPADMMTRPQMVARLKEILGIR